MKQRQQHGLSVFTFFCLSITLLSSCQLLTPWQKKEQKGTTVKADSTKKEDSKFMAYDKLAKGARIDSGLFQVLEKEGNYYFDIPFALMDKDFLLIQKVSSVPLAINEAGVNKGMNFENKVIRFSMPKYKKEVWVSEMNPQVEVAKDAAITQSVMDNYTPSFIESFKIEGYGKDSTSVIIKVNKVFDGTEKSFMDIFSSLGLGTSAKTSLSSIEEIKSFENNVIVKSVLSTKVTEGNASIPITIKVTNNIYALPEKSMVPRFADPRIGYFTHRDGTFRMNNKS